MNKGITEEQLKAFDLSFTADRANAAAMNAVTGSGLKKAAKNRQAMCDNRHDYSVIIDQGDITNQKQSGRCWMFAALNTFRFQTMKKLNLKTFELSQAYTFFYDKLEKANYFLESILETLDEPTDGRLIAFLLQAPVGDGGQWDMFCNLIRKYGAVPKSVYPESAASSASREMDACLTELLRGDACSLRKAYAAGAGETALRAKKEEMLGEIYRVLCICLGQPPKTFDFEWRDEDKNFHRDCGISPKEFWDKYVGLNLDDYVSLINAPTKDKPYGKSYSVRFLGNVKEGRPVRYLNLEIGELKKAAIAQMQDGEPVWFGCDVGACSERDMGIMDTDIYQMENLMNIRFTMDKAERLDYGQSMMTHAMVFQGVNLDEDGKPNRWRVENSWGEDTGNKGYYLMSDRWFDEYMYQVVVNKKYLSEEQIKAYEAEPVMLEPWDPMGSLAL